MKGFINYALILTFILLLGCSEIPSHINLTQAVEEFNLAFRNSNVELLSTMITDDYIHTNGNSPPIDKNTGLNILVNESNH